VDLFVGKLQSETIHESCSWLDIAANNGELQALYVALSDKIKERGITEFVRGMTIDILRRYCEDMRIENKNVSKGDVEEQIKEEVMLLGIEQLLSKLTVSVLKEFYEALKGGKVAAAVKKEALIEHVVLKLYSEAPVVLKPIKDEVTGTPRRASSVSNIEINHKTPKKELEQMLVKDLREYLKAKGLKYDDKKSVLVSRVLREQKNAEADGISQPPTPLIETEDDTNTNTDNNNHITTITTIPVSDGEKINNKHDGGDNNTNSNYNDNENNSTTNNNNNNNNNNINGEKISKEICKTQ